MEVLGKSALESLGATATALLTLSTDDGSPSPMRTIRKRGRTPYVQRSRRNHPLGPPTIAPPQPIDKQFSEISYSPILQTQPLDLTSPPVIDPAIQEILGYSPPALEERFPLLPPLEKRFSPPPSHEEGFLLPLPPLDQLPLLLFQLNPEPID
ncbi:hypothetical protein G5I_02590 [Acromyrmex echinatior]|uniref:Uncharacterized protein n=1 Tax=Acromyrmex echinatior TaxID=103372 RepID=F4WAQ1_ACREC|nr:hypothetical protein G5I_02590 [Acromyrmex echinatior]